MHYLPILPYRFLLRYPFDNERAIRRVKCPVFIFHGMHDNVVPYASALRLYAAIPSEVEREVIAFPRGHHGNLLRFPRFHRKLRRILNGLEEKGRATFARPPAARTGASAEGTPPTERT